LHPSPHPCHALSLPCLDFLVQFGLPRLRLRTQTTFLLHFLGGSQPPFFKGWRSWGPRSGCSPLPLPLLTPPPYPNPSLPLWPDLLSQRLYWVDSKLHQLSSIDFNGGNRKVLIFSVDTLSHPFGIAVFEDRVFWTDLENEAIFSANRLNGLEISVLAENLNNPHDIVIFHELKQPKAPDACEQSFQPNGGCEYLCLPAPQISIHSPKYTCACPDSMWLGPDMKRCYRAPPSTSTTTSPSTATRTPGTSLGPGPVSLPGHTRNQSSGDASLSVGTAPSEPTISASSPGVPTPGNSNHSQHYGTMGGKLVSTATAAVIGIIVPVGVIALLGMSGYLIWRNWKRKNTKSMNFDNPVYRKTTEEEDEDEIHIGRTAQIGHVYPARVALSLEDDGLP
uniref:LDL receptor related protein 8 n=1 Tax=Sarcophilus harrisii TaxID=9305 RepID=A0A7N4P8P5_SARHA